MTKAFELSAENKLLRKENTLYAARVVQLLNTVDSVKVYVEDLQVISRQKDEVIANDQQMLENKDEIIGIQSDQITGLRKDLKQAKRRGNWKAVGFGIGGFSIGVGVGILIGILK